jgi:hypothetical protein
VAAQAERGEPRGELAAASGVGKLGRGPGLELRRTPAVEGDEVTACEGTPVLPWSSLCVAEGGCFFNR